MNDSFSDSKYNSLIYIYVFTTRCTMCVARYCYSKPVSVSVSCPSHFCQRLFLRLMQIRWVFTGGGEGVGQVWSLTRQSLPYINFKVAVLEFATSVGGSGLQFEENTRVTRHLTVVAWGIQDTHSSEWNFSDSNCCGTLSKVVVSRCWLWTILQ